MHELSIAVAMVEQAQAIALRENAKRISTLSVSIGVLSGVEREALSFAFPIAIQDTILDGAKLIIEDELLLVQCSKCNEASNSNILCFECPACGSSEVKLSGGKDIRITSLELEDNV